MPALSKTKIACVQLTTTPDVAHNLVRITTLSKQAVGAGAKVVALPEAFAFLGPEKAKRQILEPLPAGGQILHHCQTLAQELNCQLILGGFHEDIGSSDKCANTCVHLGADGNIISLYRKIHLFDVALDDGTQLRESSRTEAGDRVVTSPLACGVLGHSICYDMRFPYLYQSLVEQGASILCVPSAFTVPTGKAHWHVLLRARAIECQSYLLAPAQWGQHWEKRASYGHSLIIDPWGRILAEKAEGEGFILAEVDPAEVASVRRQLPSLQHQRDITPSE